MGFEQRGSSMKCLACGMEVGTGTGTEGAISKIMKAHDAVCTAPREAITSRGE